MINAFKHAYWSARSAQEIGQEKAADYVNAHEDGKTPASKMDLANNKVGLEIGSANPNASKPELMKLLLSAAKEGKLTILTNNGETSETKKTTSRKTTSQEQTIVNQAIKREERRETKQKEDYLRSHPFNIGL